MIKEKTVHLHQKVLETKKTLTDNNIDLDRHYLENKVNEKFTDEKLRGQINLYPNIQGCLTKPAIQFALSAHVIMKLLSFMIPPHLLFFVAVPRIFSPVPPQHQRSFDNANGDRPRIV